MTRPMKDRMNLSATNQPPQSSELITVVLVGHCGPDAYLLRSAVQRALPHSSIAMVNDESTVRRDHWRPDRVLLVNRVLDGDFSVEGLGLIGRAAADAAGPIVLLVSNYDEAQQAATASGALPGFGKQELYAPETAAKLRTAAERALDAAGTIGER